MRIGFFMTGSAIAGSPVHSRFVAQPLCGAATACHGHLPCSEICAQTQTRSFEINVLYACGVLLTQDPRVATAASLLGVWDQETVSRRVEYSAVAPTMVGLRIDSKRQSLLTPVISATTWVMATAGMRPCPSAGWCRHLPTTTCMVCTQRLCIKITLYGL